MIDNPPTGPKKRVRPVRRVAPPSGEPTHGPYQVADSGDPAKMLAIVEPANLERIAYVGFTGKPNLANARLLAAAWSLREALAELVALKAIKDSEGKTPEYEERQPKAWDAARAALERAGHGPLNGAKDA